ncbi:Uncharacterised protein [Vibrio cholerae]|nr:Uncharacterised protein [Vibrio cholerae]
MPNCHVFCSLAGSSNSAPVSLFSPQRMPASSTQRLAVANSSSSIAKRAIIAGVSSSSSSSEARQRDCGSANNCKKAVKIGLS